MRQNARDERMPCLVIRRELLLLFREQVALALRAEHYLFNRADQVVLCDLGAALASSKYCPLVHKRVELCAREAGRAFSNDSEIDVRPKRLFACMDFKNLLPVAPVGEVDSNAPVKAARAK